MCKIERENKIVNQGSQNTKFLGVELFETRIHYTRSTLRGIRNKKEVHSS